MAETAKFKYRAFLSYSHRDARSAKWLHRALENYRFDKNLVGHKTSLGPVPKTLRPIFRDRDDFSAGHSLTAQTIAALEASQFLIVLCSPNAAQSVYVNEEIRHFKSCGWSDWIIPVIVNGEPGDAKRECFPVALRFKVSRAGELTTTPEEEPLAADVRTEGDGKNVALAKIIAGLAGLNADAIMRRAERSRRRRKRIWTSIASLLVFLTIAATGSAVYAWHELQSNESFLNATLKRATAIVNEAVSQAQRYSVPASATLALLTKAEGLFDDMAEFGGPTPELRFQKALMLLQFTNNYFVLGDSQKALLRASEARDLLADLSAEKRDDLVFQSNLAAAYVEFGYALELQGDLPKAIEAFRDSLAIDERLARLNPNEIHLQIAVLDSRRNIGRVLFQQGNLQDAWKAYLEGWTLGQSLVRDKSGTPVLFGWDDTRLLLQFMTEICGVIERVQPSFALTIYRSMQQSLVNLSKSMDTEALDRQGLRTAVERDLASYSVAVNLGLAKLLITTPDRLGEAVQTYRAGISALRPLIQTDPDNTSWQHQLSQALEEMALCLAAQGNLSEALRSSDESVAIAEKFAKADPKNVDWQQAVYWNHVKRGDILLQHRRQDDALRDYQESLIVGRNLIEVDPNTVDMPLNLAETSAKAADILLTQHNFAKVQDIAADNLAIADRLAGINPTSPGPPQLRWLSYMLHGDVEWQEERQLDGAFEAYRNGLAQINLLHPLEDTFVKAFKEIRSSDAAGKLSTAGRFTPASELKTRWEQDLDLSVNRIGSLAYGFLKNRKVSQALNAADLAISLAPDKIWINANRAHALMFLGRLQEAKAVYLRYRGAKNVQSDKDWDTVILDDFAELRKAGLAHPLMGEIERLFTQQAQR